MKIIFILNLYWKLLHDGDQFKYANTVHALDLLMTYSYSWKSVGSPHMYEELLSPNLQKLDND